MATEWVDVADNAVKIGLGSALTILGGYLTLKLSQQHELRKEALIQRRKDFEVKAERYVNFLSCSRMMLQKYMMSSLRHDCEDYIEYTRLHETVSLTCAGTVAKLAMRQPFVLFKGLTFQKLCLPGAFRPGDHHNKMLRPGLCVVHASPQYL